MHSFLETWGKLDSTAFFSGGTRVILNKEQLEYGGAQVGIKS